MAQFYLGRDTYFCQLESKLVFRRENEDEVVVPLDNLEASMMFFFIEHVGEVLSKDNLMSLWTSQYVMEHSLTRVISMLRKKLNDIGKPSLFIKTVPRVGYTYIGLAVKTEALDNVSNVINTKVKNTHWKSAIVVCSIIFFLMTISYFSFHTKVEKKSILAPRVIEVMDQSTLKKDIASNSNGKIIVYSALHDNNFWFLKFNDAEENKSWDLKKDKYHLSFPVWRNDEEVIYFQWNKDHCSLRKLNITQKYDISKEQLITYCNTSNSSKGLAMLDDNTVLLSDSESISTPMQLFAVDLFTGAKRNINSYANNGLGVYRIFTSPDNQYLATLSSIDWFSTDVTLYNMKDLSKKIWHKNINFPLFSVALDNTSIVYKNLQGGFSVVNFLQDAENIKEVPMLLTRPVYSPTYMPGGFIFTEGEEYSHKIAIQFLSNDKQEILINIDNASTKHPILLNSDSILYSSNQTGINQLWLYNLTSKQQIQISDFDHPYFILNITVNIEGNKIAVSTNEGILFSDLTDNKLTNIKKTIEGKLPTFWQNKLVFNRFNDDKNEVYIYNESNDDIELLISNGAYKTISSDGLLYYSKYHTPGIWLYQENKPDQFIFNDHAPVPIDAWNIKESELYIGDTKRKSVFKINLDTKKTDELMLGSCRKINIISKNICLSTVTEFTPNRLFKFTFSDVLKDYE